MTTNTHVTVTMPASEERNDDVVNLMGLHPVFACCCCIESCFCTFPDLLGCYTNSECCCCLTDCQCCRPNTNKAVKACCVLSAGNCSLICPTTCCKGVEQCFCCDHRCAFPTDREVPCMITCFFITFSKKLNCKCVCCDTVGDVKKPQGAQISIAVNNQNVNTNPPPPPPNVNTNPVTVATDAGGVMSPPNLMVADEIKKLKELRDIGAIEEHEFVRAKEKVKEKVVELMKKASNHGIEVAGVPLEGTVSGVSRASLTAKRASLTATTPTEPEPVPRVMTMERDDPA